MVGSGPMMNNSDQLEQMAGFTSFLASSFEKEVDPLLLDRIQEHFPDFSSWIKGQNQPHLLEGSRLMEEFIQKSLEAKNQEAFLDELAVEYAGLFLGAGESPVPVIESVYLGVDHILYEKPYFEVIDFYQEHGYEKPQDFQEPEDHLAIELDFYALQLHGAVWAKEAGNEKEVQQRLEIAQKFKKEHLELWVPQACNDLFKAAVTPFYLGIAHLTMGLIAAPLP
jgi:TorA maturation chaperone TorD